MPRKPILPFREQNNGWRRLESRLNLGPKSPAWLASIGITTIDQIGLLGPIEVCRRLRAAGIPVAVTMVYALEGALSGTHWNAAHLEVRSHLKSEFEKMKREVRT